MKQIPSILVNKTIAFTGTFPGVGKSFTKNELVKQLLAQGYKVFNTGTTQKASNNGGQTVASLCLDYHNNWNIKPTRKGNLVRSKTSAFFIIDEAFMYDQRTLSMLKEHYPKCCFILFGDPMQFEPVSGDKPITEIDALFNLSKMMRCDSEIVSALKIIKSGNLPIEFMYKHTSNNVNDKMLMLCYKKGFAKCFSEQYSDTIYKTLYKSTRVSSYEMNDETHYSALDNVCNGDLWRLIDINHNVGLNKDMYTLERISGESFIITVDEDKFNIHFNKQNGLNCHKIQGDTIREDTGIIIWFDTGIVNNTQLLLRFLYVAISRARSCNQIHFLPEQVTEIVKGFKPDGELYDYLRDCPKTNTSSAELCSTDILSDFIIPNVVGQGFPNHAEGTAYKYHLSHDLVEGQNYNTTNTQDFGYQINWDEHTSRNLQSQLDSRKVMEIPGKGKNFVTINNTLDGTNSKDKVTEYHWFVLEIDHVDGIDDDKVSDYVYKNYIDSHAKHKEAKKAAFRIVYSGRRSYHFWFYVENEITSREQYKEVHKVLNKLFFDGMADSAINTPEHYVRAPGLIRTDTGKEQKLVSFKGRHTIHLDTLPRCETAVGRKDDCVNAPTNLQNTNTLVMQAFETYKPDLPTTNGGRGKIILQKLFKEASRGFLDKDSLIKLAEMMCEYCNCKEKFSRICSYLEG